MWTASAPDRLQQTASGHPARERDRPRSSSALGSAGRVRHPRGPQCHDVTLGLCPVVSHRPRSSHRPIPSRRWSAFLGYHFSCLLLWLRAMRIAARITWRTPGHGVGAWYVAGRAVAPGRVLAPQPKIVRIHAGSTNVSSANVRHRTQGVPAHHQGSPDACSGQLVARTPSAMLLLRILVRH
jgi:hypothetical protein